MILIRAIKQSDNEAVRELYKAGVAFDGVSDVYARRTLDGDLADPFHTYGDRMAVAEDRGTVVGMIAVEAGTNEIKRLMVHPSMRRRRIGSCLLVHAISHLGGMWLECMGDNTAARAMFEGKMKLTASNELVSRSSGESYTLVKYEVQERTEEGPYTQ